jgi:DNA-directed RNA polymerase I and III subunit RPAC2
LGNLLRNQIVKNKNVEFCAYSVPHPSEPVCNVRV